jgi:hypothetical protein
MVRPDGGLMDHIVVSTFGAMGLAELAAERPQHPDAPRWRHAVELMAVQKCNMSQRNPWGLIPSCWYSDRPDAARPGGTARYRYFFRYRSASGGGVPGTGLVPGVSVDGRTVLDDGIHVGHGDEDLHLVARQGLRNGKLVQVAGVVVVDGSPQEVRSARNRWYPTAIPRPPRPDRRAIGVVVRYRSRCFAAAFLSLRSFFSFTDSLGLLLPDRLFWSLFAIAHLLGSWFGLSSVVRLGRPDRVFSLSLVARIVARCIQRRASILQHGNR